MDVATLDLGNTALKLALWQAGKIVDRHRWAWRATPQATWETVAAYLADRAPALLGLCSVVPSQNSALMACLAAKLDGETCIRLVQPQSLPGFSLGIYPPAQLGSDRWVAALAAHRLIPGASSVMIINMGTSTTIDHVVSTPVDGAVYQGGAILPGLKLFAQSLPTVTDRLPETPFPAQPCILPGNNTLACLQTGLSLGYTSLIYGFVQRWQPEVVVLTGGEAPYFAAMTDGWPIVQPIQNCDKRPTLQADLPPNWRYEPLLTHMGIRVALEQNICAYG